MPSLRHLNTWRKKLRNNTDASDIKNAPALMICSLYERQ